jgi:hypothetical protein
MKKLPSNDAFNILIVGAWNPAIFTPEWTKKHLAEDQTKEVLWAMPMQMQMHMAPRLTVDGVNVYPSLQSLMIDVGDFDKNAFQKSTQVLSKIASLLPHTPVVAVGINFKFEVSKVDAAALNSLFSFEDAGKISFDQFKMIDSGIRRSFMLVDGTVLNLSINSNVDAYRCEFNFHVQASDLASIGEKITNQAVTDFYNEAKLFLEKTYEIEVNCAEIL